MVEDDEEDGGAAEEEAEGVELGVCYHFSFSSWEEDKGGGEVEGLIVELVVEGWFEVELKEIGD